MEDRIPTGWIKIPLKNVAWWGTGGTPSRKNGSYFGGKIPWAKTKDLKDDFLNETEEFITEKGLANSNAKIFPKGSVAIALYGASIGKTGILGIDSATNQSCAVAIANSDVVNNRFLFYYLRSQKQNFIKKGQGGAQPNISQTIVKAHPILLPPLPEQNRIVEKLDSLMARVEASKERLNKLSQIEDLLLQSSLVDKNEPVKIVKLEHFLEEGKEKVGENWKGIRKIGVNKQIGIVELEIGQKKTFEKYKIVKPGDFIYNPMRVNIGSIALYEGKEIAITSPDYVVFRIKHMLTPHLLLKFLKSKYGLGEINVNTQGSVRSRLYFKSLVNVCYPLASTKKREDAERLLVVLRELSKKKQQIENKLDRLSQSLLAKAFRGELVSQNSSDEPAEMLLARMRAEKSRKDSNHK